jgi:hypothetical protein
MTQPRPNMPTPAPAAPPRPTVVQMNLTPEMCAAIAAMQGKLPKIERDRTVEVETKGDKPNYGYSYATLSNVSEKIYPVLSAHGLGYVGFPGLIDQASGKASMGLRYLLTHESGGFIMGEFPLAGDGGIQGTGGRITYARRYCLLAVTGLAPDEDDDAAAAQAEDEANGGRPTAARKPRQSTAPASTTGRTAERTPRQSTRNAAPARDTVENPPPDDEPAGVEGVSRGPRDPNAPISPPQMTKLIIQFKELAAKVNGEGADYDRDVRLKMMSSLIGRPLASGKDMTMGEAHQMIEDVDDAMQRRNPIEFLKERASQRQAASA